MARHIAWPFRGSAARVLSMLVILGLGLGACSTIDSLFGEKKPANGAVAAEQPKEISEYDVKIQARPQVPAFNAATVAAPNAGPGGRVAVNNYLWRAALETVSFMPLVSADPYGGVIITDWYAPPETPTERFKLNVYILGQDLRADALKVSVFRQKQTDGQWQDAVAEKATATDLEDTILNRAERLRKQATGQ